MKNSDIIMDSSGAQLAPGDREHCQGNGEHEEFEICCDECDYFLLCYRGDEWKDQP